MTTFVTLTEDRLEELCQRAAELALLKVAQITGELWTPQQVANHFQVSTRTLQNWEANGRLPLRKNGRWVKSEILQTAQNFPKKGAHHGR